MAFNIWRSRCIHGSAALTLISGAIVLIFLVILSGVRDVTPLNKIWFLQVDTSGIKGSHRFISQWTYLFICGAHNQDCGSPVPALPVGYAWPEGSLDIPRELIGSYAKNTTSKYFYYMWRFGWVSYLIGLFFVLLAWLTAVVSIWTRLGSAVSGVLLTFGLFWHTITASLMTAVFVKARNSFLRTGIRAKVGPYAFGFTWGAWIAMCLALVCLMLRVIDKNDKKRIIRTSTKS